MKIMLVAPPWLDIYGNYRSAAKLGCVAPQLGLAYLGGAIEALGSDCKIIDMEMEAVDIDGLLQQVKQYKPDLLGISATTPVFKNAALIASKIKDEYPDMPLCIGGVHSTVVGREVLEEYPQFDFQVVGEGEFTIQEIIKSRSQGDFALENIDGVIFRKNNVIVENSKRPFCKHLDEIPRPARRLLKTELYRHYLPDKGYINYANIFTSRGCPFECVFCSQHTMYGRKVRWHSIDRVMSELKEIVEDLNVNHVIIMDETMTLKKSRIIELCRAIKEAGLKFTWEGWTHASTVDEELLKTMKEVGLIRLSFGIESGDSGILKKIKKSVTLEQIRNAYRIAKKVGIETRGSAMLGHPYETRKTAWKTIKFIRSIRECQQVFLNVACPYPGTELYACAKTGIGGLKLLTNDYAEYKRYGNPVISVNDLSANRLKRMQAYGLLYFYLTPRRIWYNFVVRAGFKAGITNAKAFLLSIMRAMFSQGRD